MRGFLHVAHANRPEEIAFHQCIAGHIGNLNLAAFAGDAYVASNVGDAHVSFLELNVHVGAGIVNFDVAVLRGRADRAADSGNVDVAAGARGRERDVFRELDIEIHGHVAAGLVLIHRMNEYPPPECSMTTRTPFIRSRAVDSLDAEPDLFTSTRISLTSLA